MMAPALIVAASATLLLVRPLALSRVVAALRLLLLLWRALLLLMLLWRPLRTLIALVSPHVTTRLLRLL